MDIKQIITPQYGTNCYLIENEDSAAVIDPGEETTELLSFTEDQKNKPNKLIILTHCHFDHIGGVEVVKNIWRCPVVIAAEEAEGLSDNRINLSGYWTNRAISITPDITVVDGDEVKLGVDTFTVIETPGHTKGSVCYLCGGILFAGDTLFRMSVGRSDLPTADPAALISSLNKLMTLDEDITVLSGHGPKTTIGFEKQNNPYF